jgi:hypothetical protein
MMFWEFTPMQTLKLLFPEILQPRQTLSNAFEISLKRCNILSRNLDHASFIPAYSQFVYILFCCAGLPAASVQG